MTKSEYIRTELNYDLPADFICSATETIRIKEMHYYLQSESRCNGLKFVFWNGVSETETPYWGEYESEAEQMDVKCDRKWTRIFKKTMDKDYPFFLVALQFGEQKFKDLAPLDQVITLVEQLPEGMFISGLTGLYDNHADIRSIRFKTDSLHGF